MSYLPKLPGCIPRYLGTYQVLSALGPTSVTRLVVGLKALLAYEFIPVDFLLFAMLTSVGESDILFRANISPLQCLTCL